MKRLVIASDKLSRVKALRNIAENLRTDPEFEDCEVSVNKDHNCVDVIFPGGDMSQIYPQEGEPKSSYGYTYRYVGPNNGDYIRLKYPRKRRYWKDELGQQKHVDRITYNNI